MAEAQKGVSFLDPSSGFLDDVDVTIVSLRAGTVKESNGTKEWPAIVGTYLPPSNKEVVLRSFAGTLDKMRPSPDGLYFVPNTDGAKISDVQPAYKLVVSIINALRAFNGDKAAVEALLAKIEAAPDRLDHYDGLNVRVSRIVEKADKSKNREKDSDYIIVSRVNALASGKPAAGAKAGAKAAAKPAAAASAAPEAPASEGGDEAEAARVLEYLIEALSKGPIKRDKVATSVFPIAKADKRADAVEWKRAMTVVNAEPFLQAAAAEPHDVGGNLVVIEYDGKEVKIA